MRSTWKLLTVAALVLIGCKGDKGTEATKTSQPGKTGEPTKPAGDQTYTIKIKEFADPGQTITAHDVQKSNGTVKLSDAKGKVLQDNKVDEVNEAEFTETVLEKGDKAPKKFKRTYKKAVLTQNSKEVHRPYEGKTIVFDLVGGSYRTSVEGGGKVPDADLLKLGNETSNKLKSDRNEAILPKKPVKVGESWVVDAKKMQDVFGDIQLDSDKSKVDAKLIKVYPKDGKQYGQIELTLNLALKGLVPFQFEPPGAITGTITIDSPIDGSSTASTFGMKMKMSGKGTFDIANMKGTVDLNFDSSATGEHSAESPAK